jgi:alkylation response protein AidB-like acyl-CoA dehydrogenase
MAISEPDVGSGAPRGIKTRAVLDGDEYVINGTKTWISNGSISDLAEVLCMVDEGKGTSELCSIIVDRRESPYAATDYHKVGWHAASTAEVSFDNCRVPKRNLIKGGGGLVQEALGMNRAFVAVRACGVAQAAIDASIRYARERVQFGKPIGRFQLIQEMIVDMVTKTDSARLLALRALELLNKGIQCPKETSMAKAYCCEIVNEVTSKAIQIHGAMGLTEDLPVERYFRDGRLFSIPDGTTEIQKLIVGREILGMHAFV